MKRTPNNPNGRPNVLRNPVQYSILIERDALAFVDSHAEAEHISRAEATRIIINKGLFSMGTPDNESEMKHTAAEYEQWANNCLDAEIDDEQAIIPTRLEFYQRAQVYATLALAAATLEAAEQPVVTSNVNETSADFIKRVQDHIIHDTDDAKQRYLESGGNTTDNDYHYEFHGVRTE